MKYELTYKQPYEMDYDSGPGIGDHMIEYATRVETFEAGDDTLAKALVKTFLSEGSVLFDHYIDGDGEIHYRESIRLTKEISLDA